MYGKLTLYSCYVKNQIRGPKRALKSQKPMCTGVSLWGPQRDSCHVIKLPAPREERARGGKRGGPRDRHHVCRNFVPPTPRPCYHPEHILGGG